MLETVSLTVSGMKCAGCEASVKNTLLALDGVSSASADHKQQLVTLEFDKDSISVQQISAAIMAAGYQVH